MEEVKMVFQRRFHSVELRKGVVSGQWSLETVDCFIQVVSNRGLTVLNFVHKFAWVYRTRPFFSF